MKGIRRFLAGAAVSVGLIGFTASPAFAHECFNASRSAQADAQIGQHSGGHFDIQTWQLLGIFIGTPCNPSGGTCPPVPANVQPLIDAQTSQALDTNTVIGVLLGFAPESALGSSTVVINAFNALVSLVQLAATDAVCLDVPTDYVTNTNATMAGGAPEKVVTNGKGVEHFPDVYGAQLQQAYGAALGGQASDCSS